VPDTGSLSSPAIISFLLRCSPKIHNLNTSKRHIATVHLRWLLYVVLVTSCFDLYFGLLSAPNSMYSTVGERCLRFCFVVPTFGNACLGLLSCPNITVQYCWREVSLFSFVLFLLSVVPLLVCCQVGVSLSFCPYIRLSCPNLLFLTYWLFVTCFDLFGLLSGPNSMYSVKDSRYFEETRRIHG
jgi:hypothetical protein